MNHQSTKWRLALLISTCLAVGSLKLGAAAPADDKKDAKAAESTQSPNVEKKEADDSKSVSAWIAGIFTVSPEEKAAREAGLRAKADARTRELADAIAKSTDAKEKAELEKTAKEHTDKEAKRRADVEARAKREAQEKAAEDARLKAKAAAKAKADAEARAREQARAKRIADEKAAEDARLKAKAAAKAKADAEARAKEEQEKKARELKAAQAAAEKKALEAARTKREAEEKAAKEAALKTKAEQEEKAQAERAAALTAKLKTREEARVKAETEAKAKAEQEKKARIDAVAQSAAQEKAREQTRVKQESERRTAREAKLRAGADAKAKGLADAIAKAKDPKEKAKLQKEAEDLAANEAKRRDAFAASEAEFKARSDARANALAEREKRDIERAAAPTAERSKWRLSAGVTRRTIHSQTFKSGSYSQTHPIAAKSRDSSHAYDAASDTVSSADRDYDDGYVHIDDWTDLDGGTWNWGYDSGSQVRDGTLVLRWLEKSFTKFTRTTTSIPGERESGSDSDCGVYLQAERVLKQAGPMDCGLHLDASRVSFSSSGDFMTFSDQQNWATYYQYAEDSYSLAGTGITSDSPPNQGNLTTPGPIINNTPDSRQSEGSTKVSSGSYQAFNTVAESLDLDLSTISLGMTLSGNYRRLYVTGVTGPTLTMVDTDAFYEEALYQSSNGGTPSVLASWNDEQNATEYNVGFFVQGELGLRLIRGLELGVFGRYDWIENVSGVAGQTHYVVNPEGGSFGGTMNYAF